MKDERAKEALWLLKEVNLWDEFDYRISVIGASTPFSRTRKLKKLNAYLVRKRIISLESKNFLETKITSIEDILNQGGRNPDLNVLETSVKELIQEYVNLEVISEKEYKTTEKEIKEAKDSYAGLDEKTRQALDDLKRSYLGL